MDTQVFPHAVLRTRRQAGVCTTTKRPVRPGLLPSLAGMLCIPRAGDCSSFVVCGSEAEPRANLHWFSDVSATISAMVHPS